MGDSPRVEALGGAACLVRICRQGARLRLTAIVKATFSLPERGALVLVEPEPIRERDVHEGDSPIGSVRYPSELAPYRDASDVLFVGTAHAPDGNAVSEMTVRLALIRDRQALIDKRVRVTGPAFVRMPLTYERAPVGDDNPHGVDPGGEPPNLHADEGCSAGFGPISRQAASRRARQGQLRSAMLRAPRIDLPDHVDWRYFSDAPAEQRLPGSLASGDVVVLEGVHPHEPAQRISLPALSVKAFVGAVDADAAAAVGAEAGRFVPVPLEADTLLIDGDAGRATIVWRGQHDIADADAAPHLRVVAFAAALGEEPPLPAVHEVSPEPVAPPSATEPPPLDGTMALTVGAQGAAAQRAASPFGPPDAALQGVVGSPFGPPPAEVPVGAPSPFAVTAALQIDIKPIPQPIGSGTVTRVDRFGTTKTLTPEQLAAGGAMPFAVRVVGDPVGSPTARPTDPLTATGALSLEQPAQRPLPFAPGEVAAPRSEPRGSVDAPWTAERGRSVPTPSTGLDRTMELRLDALARSTTAGPPPEPALEPATDPTGASPAATSPALLPPRRGRAVPIATTTARFTMATSPWQHRPPRPSLTLVVKGSFDLAVQGPTTPRAEPDPLGGDVTWPGSTELRCPSDFAQFKANADVTLAGHAYPAHEGATVRTVRLSFGHDTNRFERELVAIGPRQWTSSAGAVLPEAPGPLAPVALRYANAFGGPDQPRNPAGVGHRGRAGEAMPSLEDPKALLRSPTDKVAPVCFGPISPAWDTRAARIGRFDRAWQRGRWPYFPEGFSWSYFQHAPPEQQLAYLRGDEPFRIEGVHPGGAPIEGRLSGTTPRVFLTTYLDDGTLQLEAVTLHLDTVHIDTDAMRVQQIWRGVLDVSDEHAPEIAWLLLTEAGVDEEITTEQAYARLLAEVGERVVVPDAPDAPPPVAPDPAPADPETRAAAESLARRAAQRDALVGALPANDTAEPADEGASADDGPDPGGPAAEEPASEGPSEEDAAARDLLSRLLAEGKAERADFSGRDFSGMDLSGGALAGILLSRANLRGARLSGADLAGANLSGADLSAVQLQHANLTGADLSDAVLTKASLSGVVLELADLSRIHADDANLRGARGERARFNGASLRRARFDGAVMPRAAFNAAVLDEAVFDGANLSRARFFEAAASGASFAGATLAAAILEDAVFKGGKLPDLRAPRSAWERVDLAGAILSCADLSEASFEDASLRGADLSRASLREARLTRADLTEANLHAADLHAANLERATLRKADLRDANLHEAETRDADLEGARLEGALLAGTKLHAAKG